MKPFNLLLLFGVCCLTLTGFASELFIAGPMESVILAGHQNRYYVMEEELERWKQEANEGKKRAGYNYQLGLFFENDSETQHLAVEYFIEAVKLGHEQAQIKLNQLLDRMELEKNRKSLSSTLPYSIVIKNNEECALCCCNLFSEETGNAFIARNQCGHLFHSSCMKKYEEGRIGSKEKVLCPSCEDPCMCDYVIGMSEKSTAKLTCGHFWHSACIEDWKAQQEDIGEKPTCPICRKEIGEYKKF